MSTRSRSRQPVAQGRAGRRHPHRMHNIQGCGLPRSRVQRFERSLFVLSTTRGRPARGSGGVLRPDRFAAEPGRREAAGGDGATGGIAPIPRSGRRPQRSPVAVASKQLHPTSRAERSRVGRSDPDHADRSPLSAHETATTAEFAGVSTIDLVTSAWAAADLTPPARIADRLRPKLRRSAGILLGTVPVSTGYRVCVCAAALVQRAGEPRSLGGGAGWSHGQRHRLRPGHRRGLHRPRADHGQRVAGRERRRPCAGGRWTHLGMLPRSGPGASSASPLSGPGPIPAGRWRKVPAEGAIRTGRTALNGATGPDPAFGGSIGSSANCLSVSACVFVSTVGREPAGARERRSEEVGSNRSGTRPVRSGGRRRSSGRSRTDTSLRAPAAVVTGCARVTGGEAGS